MLNIESRPIGTAFLIMAHHQPNHLARLIRALDQDGSYFFIHIDVKISMKPFNSLIPERQNITFVMSRAQVEWAKFSVVAGILNLLETAIAAGPAVKYYTLLSGSDYPIKQKTVIRNYLENTDAQHMRVDRKLTRERGDKFTHFLKRLPRGKYFGNMTPYHGSMYWSLTADCVRFILDFVRNNPEYINVHRHVFAPDEVFFHTIVKHSPFAEGITQDFVDRAHPDHTRHANHFIDWAGLRKRKRLIVDERDLDDLLASPALFARKFDERKSRTLLDFLDARVHSTVGHLSEA
jgi:Core-2/I-Branching enzyme